MDSYFRCVLKGAFPGQAYESLPIISTAQVLSSLCLFIISQNQSVTLLRLSDYFSEGQTHVPPNSADQHDFDLTTLISSYQMRGHLVADLNPLEINEGQQPRNIIYSKMDELKKDMKTVFKLPPETFIGGEQKSLPLGEIIQRLENAYCKHIGIEMAHIKSREIVDWIKNKFEPPNVKSISEQRRKFILEQLIACEVLEKFLNKKWHSQPRFGLEGGETLIPGLHEIVDSCAGNGAECIIIGTSHRGRVNLLATICERPLELIFAEFLGAPLKENLPGDVKYHLGSNSVINNKTSNRRINIILPSNPSHLELVDPFALGMSKAEKKMRRDEGGNKVVTIILHGDAGISGEGVVYESFNLAGLPCFSTHGTIHIVCNNQLGYTTFPHIGRSSTYCTAVATMRDNAVLHVNGDDPDAVMYCCKVAAEFRSKFQMDAIVDIIGYRRRGHSEIDDPTPTAPILYKKIQSTPTVMEIYSKQLIEEKIVTEAEYKSLVDKYDSQYREAFKKAEEIKTRSLNTWLDINWEGYFKEKDPMKIEPTGVKEDILIHIGNIMSTPPEKFGLHRAVKRILKGRADMLKDKKINWPLAEAMAYGTLLKEGIHVRMTGEDCERGTFHQRHHVYHDVNNEMIKYNPMTKLFPEQEEYCICNSPLTECAVLGFETGYASTNPNALVIWEAQYGDFANVAQPIFDNFIASGEVKWLRQCGLVMMLPHGMEGAGPEHSNARVERFLQMASDDPNFLPDLNDKNLVINQLRKTNWIIANCSTPANLFHILRRQIKLPFRKPLVLMTPKSLLRHPEVISPLSDLIEGTEFRRLIPEDGPASKDPDKVEKLIFCTGKAYFDLKKIIKEKNLESKIAVTRIEQLCPFPYDLVRQEILKYSKVELCWGQEEPMNSGPWEYVSQRLTKVSGQKHLIYAGRQTSACPGSADKSQFHTEQQNYVMNCIKLK